LPKPEPATTLRKFNQNSDGPSIRDILAGKPVENSMTLKEQHSIYSGNHLSDSFTEEDFRQKWEEFTTTIDSPNLKITLSKTPEFNAGFKFILKVENTVQEELVKSIKPGLVAFLRKELRNSSIDVLTQMVETSGEKIIYSDDEKYAEMVKLNPDLFLLRQKFNLDFGD
jgi:hypothetical protein